MSFITPTPEFLTEKLQQLSSNTKPLWGTMSAQKMVEHVTDSLSLSLTEIKLETEISKETEQQAQGFLMSEHPLPKNFKADFLSNDESLRNNNITAAVEELNSAFEAFHSYFSANPSANKMHPGFGNLNYEQWKMLNSKHITHHFQQFGLI